MASAAQASQNVCLFFFSPVEACLQLVCLFTLKLFKVAKLEHVHVCKSFKQYVYFHLVKPNP